MALLTFYIIIFIIIIAILNFIFFGPIIPSSDNVNFSPPYSSFRDINIVKNTGVNAGVREMKIMDLSYGLIQSTTPEIYARRIFIKTKNLNSLDGFPSYFMVTATDFLNDLHDIILNYKTKAIVYIHGFNSTNEEVIDFGTSLIKRLDKENIVFLAPPLPGTDYKPKAYESITVHDYLFYIHKFMSLVLAAFDEVYLFGSSTGCSYITWYLHRFNSPQIKGVAFWSPNIEIHPFEKFVSQLALFPCGMKLISLLDQRIYKTSNTFDMYQFVHFVGIMGLFRKIRFDLAEDLPPLLVFYNKDDKVVDSSFTETFMKKYPHKTKKLTAIDTEEHNLIFVQKHFPFFENEIIDFFSDLNTSEVARS